MAAWTELNERQQGTLAVIFELDQEAEQARRAAGGRGEFSREPASVWRAIDFAHDPSLRDLVGWTEMQTRLERRGWDNQGNGSTVAALADRALIRRSWRETRLGVMKTVRLTTEGRSAARAGCAMPRGRKAALGHRSWEVLALLWAADRRGELLKWGNSPTIEKVLIARHVPPLAEAVAGGYRLTDRGRWFYREFYDEHVAAHPDVRAPHPDGAEAEPWPREADEILAAHRRFYGALCEAWKSAAGAQQAAEAEAGAGPPKIPEMLPAAVVVQVQARHQLWKDTARQRADLAASQAAEFAELAERAARSYAIAALAALRAAVEHAAPLDLLAAPGDAGDWDEQRVPPPAETGIHAIDAEATKLHADAVGAPLRRRGPAPRRRARYAALVPRAPEPPGAKHAALADFLRPHVAGGTLLRRLHADQLTRARSDG